MVSNLEAISELQDIQRLLRRVEESRIDTDTDAAKLRVIAQSIRLVAWHVEALLKREVIRCA